MNQEHILSEETFSSPNVYWDIYTQEQVITQLQNYPSAYSKYLSFQEDQQLEILHFMQGQKGIKITYDPFFQYVFNPESHPDRLEDFLHAILKQPVTIKKVMKREGEQLSNEGSFVILDILVQTEAGSFIDIEMQKIGYAFPGERASCYTSDLTMRQYNRVKKNKGKNFTYKDLKKIYLIVLLENSSKEFQEVYPHYFHEKQVSYSSGANVVDLAQTIYISLDTFQKVVQNIDNKLHAWLTFLSTDNPAKIMELIHAYPEFKELYDDILLFRSKPEELMNMYSEALSILDRNTELYMLQELQNEAESLKKARISLSNENVILKAYNSSLANENVALKESQASLTNENVALKESQASLTNENVALKESQASLTNENSLLRAEIERLQKALQK